MARRDKNISARFFRMYYRVCRDDRTNLQNYEHTERLHKKKYKVRCFKNYESFRKAKEYHLNKEN